MEKCDCNASVKAITTERKRYHRCPTAEQPAPQRSLTHPNLITEDVSTLDVEPRASKSLPREVCCAPCVAAVCGSSAVWQQRGADAVHGCPHRHQRPAVHQKQKPSNSEQKPRPLCSLPCPDICLSAKNQPHTAPSHRNPSIVSEGPRRFIA
jgi:hypothetical protein